MKVILRLGGLSALLLVLAACYQASAPTTPPILPTRVATPIPANLTSVEVRTVIVKLVEFPSDRDRDFVQVNLDGSYRVYFDESTCINYAPSFPFAQYDSIRHCQINEPDIVSGLVNDQAWLDSRLSPYRQFVSCINGWVYLGSNHQDPMQQVWFVEMFGFPGFCS